VEHQLESLVDGALERVSDWMREAGLRLATHKTEAVLLTGKRRLMEHIAFQTDLCLTEEWWES
jgi:hypothetical protein